LIELRLPHVLPERGPLTAAEIAESSAQYQAMLRKAGFSRFGLADRVDDTLYGVSSAR
jgi:hypothetical protein